MIKRIILAGLSLSLFYGQSVLAENKASLPGSGSHFNFSLSGFKLNVTTTTPNRTYPNAGIQVLTPGVTVSGNVRSTKDGFYLFSVSDRVPASINLLGSGTVVNIKICLNGVGKKYSCETQAISGLPNTHYIFVTDATYQGNLGGVAGADAICQSTAYQSGSMVPLAGLKFKALLVTATRYPCSSKNGGVSGSCGGSFARDWPLVVGTPYLNVNGSSFNTVNTNGVFDGFNPVLFTEQNTFVSNQPFWTGIQSILSNVTGTDIVGWAYTDMNSAADGTAYVNNLATCNNFTSSSAAVYSSLGLVGQVSSTGTGPGTVPDSSWGNYYTMDNTETSGLSNLFNIAGNSSSSALLFASCNGARALVCVS